MEQLAECIAVRPIEAKNRGIFFALRQTFDLRGEAF
jgi:hypothetical protein